MDRSLGLLQFFFFGGSKNLRVLFHGKIDGRGDIRVVLAQLRDSQSPMSANESRSVVSMIQPQRDTNARVDESYGDVLEPSFRGHCFHGRFTDLGGE